MKITSILYTLVLGRLCAAVPVEKRDSMCTFKGLVSNTCMRDYNGFHPVLSFGFPELPHVGNEQMQSKTFTLMGPGAPGLPMDDTVKTMTEIVPDDTKR